MFRRIFPKLEPLRGDLQTMRNSGEMVILQTQHHGGGGHFRGGKPGKELPFASDVFENQNVNL